MTLRLRIALILAGVALTVSVLAGVAAYAITSTRLRSSIDDTLTSTAAAVNVNRGDQNGRGGRGGAGEGDGDCPTAGTLESAAAAQLVDESGGVVACIDGGPSIPTTAAQLAVTGDERLLTTVAVDGDDYRVVTVAWHDGGILQIARSLSESNGLLGRLRWELGALISVATIVAAGLGWVVATRLVRPIVRLRDATHHISSTLDFSTPIGVTASGEVGSLAASFTTMVAVVGRSQDQQRRLVADASHEMRTPLTSLRSNIELFRRIDELPSAERGEVVEDVLVDIDELSTMLGELVDLASDLRASETEEMTQLGDLARSVATRTARRTGRDIVVVDHGVAVNVRPRQLERAIGNLVDNAVKYSLIPTGVEIEVDDTSVVVRDRGRGLSDDDLPHVFDRFYRAVDARSEPGSGLGLSIVDEIVRSHGGAVFAHKRSGGGAVVGFTLPVARVERGA